MASSAPVGNKVPAQLPEIQQHKPEGQKPQVQQNLHAKVRVEGNVQVRRSFIERLFGTSAERAEKRQIKTQPKEIFTQKELEKQNKRLEKQKQGEDRSEVRSLMIDNKKQLREEKQTRKETNAREKSTTLHMKAYRKVLASVTLEKKYNIIMNMKARTKALGKETNAQRKQNKNHGERLTAFKFSEETEPHYLEGLKYKTEAHYQLSKLYREGKGVVTNLDLADEHLRYAAKKGNSEALYEFGIQQVNKGEIADGIVFLEKLAVKGSVRANLALARLYATKDVPNCSANEACTKSLKYFDKIPITKVYARNFYNDGMKHMKKDHKNVVLAIGYLSNAAKSGSVKALSELGEIYATQKIPNREPKEALKISLDYLRKGADKKDAVSQYYLGKVLQKSKGNPKEIRQTFEKAAKQHHSRAQFALAMIYLNGDGGIEKAPLKAIHLLEKSADNEYIRAHYNLAQLFSKKGQPYSDPNKADVHIESASKEFQTLLNRDGGLEKLTTSQKKLYHDIEYALGNIRSGQDRVSEALSIWEKSADKMHNDSLYAIGEVYHHGKGEVRKDISKAIEYYEKAGNHGHSPSCRALGAMYMEGKDVPKDATKTQEWYEKANNQVNVIHV